jgi:subtilisin family serine protease
MAAPHVSGVAALLYEQAGGTLDPEQVRALIRQGAANRGIAPILGLSNTNHALDNEHEGILSACGALGELCP